MNVGVLLSSILTSGAIILMSVLLYQRTKIYEARHLNLLSLALFLQAMLPLSFIPQGIYEGAEHSDIVTTLAIIGASLFLTGLLVFIWNLKIHQKVEVPKRYLGLIFVSGFAIASIVFGTDVTWNGEIWEIKRGVFTRVMMFAGVAWVIAERIRLFFVGFKVSETIWGKLSIAYIIGLALSFIMLALRDELGLTTYAYQLPTAIGGFVFTISLIKSPDSLIIPNIKVSNIILAHRGSGIAVVNYPEDIEEDSRMELTANALSGIVQIIKEIAGKKTLPQRLGYADYTIGIYPVTNIFIYAISNGYHPLLDGLLRQLATTLDGDFSEFQGIIDKIILDKFSDGITTSMKIFL